MSIAALSETIQREDQPTSLTVDDLVARSRKLRFELKAAGKKVDAENIDTSEGIARCNEERLNALSIPVAYGGLSDGSPVFSAEAWLEIVTNLSASDGSLGQTYLASQLVVRELLQAGDAIPAATVEEVFDGVLNRGLRLTASNSEAGSPRPVKAEKVPGGVRVSGTKTFNSNSGGGGIAAVGARMEGIPGFYHALIPLDSDGVTLHRDWDNMGQRGTCSQSITYDNVFVPDGWHWQSRGFAPGLLPLGFMLHGSLVLGSGFGALDTALQHLRETNRVGLRRFANAVEDPLMMRRVGVMSAKLNAALAYQRLTGRALDAMPPGEDLRALMIDGMRSKTVSVEAGLEAANGLFDLTGARTTSNTFRFDRFWRNARTFACHDPVDTLFNWVGAWELQEEAPDFFVQFGL